METQRMPTHRQYAENSRVDPNFPLPSSFPPSQENEQQSLTNGLARTTSNRRRTSGSGPPTRLPMAAFPQPPVPEVPKAPPVSYRPPHDLDKYGPYESDYPSASFAERARALNSNSITTQSPETNPEPASRPAKPVRRGSLNRPIGGVYSEIQQHKRDSFPPPNGPVSPRRFSNPTSPKKPLDSDPQSQTPNSAVQPRNSKSESIRSQPSTRRASAGFMQADNKEWASDRSPLQNLEAKLSDISKEEKRARVLKAEQRLRDSQAFDKRRRSEQGGDSMVDRASSRRASANTGEVRQRERRKNLDPAPISYNNSPQSEPKSVEPLQRSQLQEIDKVPQARKRRESLPADTEPQFESENNMSKPGPPDDHVASRRNSRRQGRVFQDDQRMERGVRFQGQDGAEDTETYSSDHNLADLKRYKRFSETEDLPGPDEARKSQRDKLRRNPPEIANPTSTKELPRQQKDLYSSRVEKGQGAAPTAAYGGTSDPVPRHAVPGRGQASNYEVPPQTTAGIHARQAAGFSNEQHNAGEVSAHRKQHHLSNILHRGHNHTVDNDGKIGSEPKCLDEWRRAGTARLTAADFGSADESEKEQLAWWEGGGSGSQRKSGRSTKRKAQPLEGDYPITTGKSESILSRQSDPVEEARSYRGTARETRTRQYVGEDEYAKLAENSKQPHENLLNYLLHRSRHDQDPGFSSAYSYSCPNLAIHDLSHPDHICEPYLSKELIQSMRSIRIRPAPELATFDPPLYLKCGPLLRYTGMKRDRAPMKTRSGGSSSVERETWRGSVMIVTADADSSYDPVPTLRLFSEPMDILRPTPHHQDGEDSQELPSEYIDPVAGLPKLSRSGRTIYVKPVDDLEHGKDLSRLENDDGLFEETRTAAVPTAYGTPDFRASSANPKSNRGEKRKPKKGRQVKGVRLHAERGVTFWRFNLEVELGAEQSRIAYSINNSPSVGFWVPARGHSMNIMFHSCNGFSMSVK